MLGIQRAAVFGSSVPLRARTEIALGSKFEAQSYHDFLLAQGLLPPDLLEKAVRANYVAPRLGAH